MEVFGSGAAFPSSVYTTWASAFTKEKAITVTYKATNAADGAKRIIAREIDFGAAQPPLPRAEVERNKLVQIPTMVGAIVPVYNIPGVPAGALRLTGAVVAEIYADNIKTWNDPRITELNPQLRLPAQPITRIVREPGAGVTDAWTRYLSAVSPSWAKAFGSGMKIEWRGAVTVGKGNDGMVQAVNSATNSIGYTSFDRVKKDRLNYAQLKNSSGQFVAPTDSGMRAGLKLSKMFSEGDEGANLIDLEGRDTWPILDATYILLDAQPKSAARTTQTLRFFYWAFEKGDTLLKDTGFVPLPPVVQARVIRYLSEVRPVDGQKIFFMW